MSNRKWLALLYPLALAVVLGACSGEAEESINSTPEAEQATQSDDEVQATSTETITEQPATEEPETSVVPVGSAAEELPEYMPKDFPLPEDAVVTTSHGSELEGKKTVMLIFDTRQSMQDITKLYTDYFKSLNLTNIVQTADDKNLVIQGQSQSGDESWSIIGGPLAAEEGVIELTFTWGEV